MTVVQPGEGAGEAFDAQVITTEDVGVLTAEELAEWAAYQAAQELAVALSTVSRMQTKVAKAEADLAAAQSALADAEAAVAAMEEG